MGPPGPRPSSPFWTAALTRPPFSFGLRVGRAQRRKGGWRRRICTVFQPRMSVTSGYVLLNTQDGDRDLLQGALRSPTGAGDLARVLWISPDDTMSGRLRRSRDRRSRWAAGAPAATDPTVDVRSPVSAQRRRMASSSRRAPTTCPHTTPSDLVISPRKSTAAPFPCAEVKGPSAPVTAGDPVVARSGVVAHGAHGIPKE